MSVGNGAVALRPVEPPPPPVLRVNEDAEHSAVGAVLLSERALDSLREIGLVPDDFWHPGLAVVYAGMCEMADRGEAIDRVTLRAHLKRSGKLDAAGGMAAVEALAAAPPLAGNAAHYGRIVRDEAAARRLLAATYRVQQRIGTHTGDVDGLLAEAQQLMETATSSSSRQGSRLRKMFPDGVDAIDVDDVTWRCDAFAADGHLTVLAGEGGEGKSLLTLALADAVQGGKKVAGISCGLGKVVMIDAENGERIMAKRLKQAQMSLAGLEIFDAENIDLRDPRDRRDVLAACEGAQLVILDSLRMLAPGAKENDSDEMAPVMKFCKSISRRTGAAVILVHHKGKGEGDYRGSSAIRDQTDLLFVLERHKGDPMGSKRRSIRCVKCRVDQEPPTRWFSIIGGKELSFVEAAPFDRDEEIDQPRRRAIAEAVVTFVRENGPSGRKAIAVGVGKDERDGTLKRALEALVNDELLSKVGPKYAMGPEGATAPDDPRVDGKGPLLKEEDPLTPEQLTTGDVPAGS